MTRSTREETEKRIDTIVLLLINGASPKEIITYAVKNWGVVPSRVYQYIEEARSVIRKSKSVDLDFELARELLRRDFLYQKALREEGVFAALAVAKDRCVLLGLYEPIRIQVTQGNSYADLTKDEARAALETLQKLLSTRTIPAADRPQGAATGHGEGATE